MSGFSVRDMLNPSSLAEGQKEKEENSKIFAMGKPVRVSYKNLAPHPENKYPMNAIVELADSIQSYGVLQPALIKKQEDGKYKVYAGHRRRLATQYLVEERNLPDFELIDCVELPQDEPESISMLKLHATNLENREMSEYDKMENIADMEKWIDIARKEGHDIIRGKTRKIISDRVGLKETQVQKYRTIQKNATPEVKEQLKEQKITVEEAYAITAKKAEGGKKTSPKAKVAPVAKPEPTQPPVEVPAAPVEDKKAALTAAFEAFKKVGSEYQNPELNLLITQMESKIAQIVEQENAIDKEIKTQQKSGNKKKQTVRTATKNQEGTEQKAAPRTAKK